MHEHKNYHFLTGDVNHRSYGGKWFKRLNNSQGHVTVKGQKVKISDYYVIETINFPEATGEEYKPGEPYYGCVHYIDLTANAWNLQIVHALESCGWINDDTILTERLILEAVHSYMGGDDMLQTSGKNYAKLLQELKDY